MVLESRVHKFTETCPASFSCPFLAPTPSLSLTRRTRVLVHILNLHPKPEKHIREKMSDRVDNTSRGEVPPPTSVLKGHTGIQDHGNYALPGMNAPGDLLSFLVSGTGLNKWNVTTTYPTRQCDFCLEHCSVQDFVRSPLPYGPLATNHAGCNTCKFKSLHSDLTREDFARMYLGFEGVWDIKHDEQFYAGLCAKLWVPNKEKKFYAGSYAKLWSAHKDEKVYANLSAKLGALIGPATTEAASAVDGW
ncbi:hypothetical protein VUR80DRAFT_4040 [Thermomyces stellatus]